MTNPFLGRDDQAIDVSDTPRGELEVVHTFTDGPMPTGVSVSHTGRIFVNFPRWTEDTAVSVAELKDGKLTPFPDSEWNAWRNARKDDVSPKDHWVCVQSVVADQKGNFFAIFFVDGGLATPGCRVVETG